MEIVVWIFPYHWIQVSIGLYCYHHSGCRCHSRLQTTQPHNATLDRLSDWSGCSCSYGNSYFTTSESSNIRFTVLPLASKSWISHKNTLFNFDLSRDQTAISLVIQSSVLWEWFAKKSRLFFYVKGKIEKYMFQ